MWISIFHNFCLLFCLNPFLMTSESFFWPAAEDGSLENLGHDILIILERNLENHTDLLQSIKDVFYAENKNTEIVDCTSCIVYMNKVNAILKEPEAQSQIIEVATLMCEQSKKMELHKCPSWVDRYSKHLFAIATKYVLTPEQVCSELYGRECVTPITEKPTWRLNFPASIKPVYLEPASPPQGQFRNYGKVLHLSDIHLDRRYVEEINGSCGGAQCCRSVTADPKPPEDAAARCGTPIVELEMMLSKLTKENFDLVLVTGDISPLDSSHQSASNNLDHIRIVNDLMWKHFPNTSVVQTLGNHEAVPRDFFIPPHMDEERTARPMAWLYDAVGDQWLKWLPVSTEVTIRRGGFWAFTPSLLPGLKVISINSNIGASANWYSNVNNTDHYGMLQWLVNELQDAENKNLKVWLLTHRPRLTQGYYMQRFEEIIHRYINVIVGWFSGYTQFDEFRVIYDSSIASKVESTGQRGTPALTGFVAPSVTTYENRTMSYRVYKVDAKRKEPTYRVMDYDTYYLNMSRVNNTGKLGYNFKTAYDMPSLLPMDMHNLYIRMHTGDTGLAQKYAWFYYNKGAQSCHDYPSSTPDVCIQERVKRIPMSLQIVYYHNHTNFTGTREDGANFVQANTFLLLFTSLLLAYKMLG